MEGIMTGILSKFIYMQVNVFYFALLAECGFCLIKFIAKFHTYMNGNSHLRNTLV